MIKNQVSVLPSYRNQSIDLHSKSIDWFLYEENTVTSWVKQSKGAKMWNKAPKPSVKYLEDKICKIKQM